jgi:hypothetical protein
MALSDRAPDWVWWRHVPTVALHEAVALSLNINPRQLRRASTHALPAGRQFEEGPDFEQRLTLARRCLSATLPGPENSVAVRYYDEAPVVKLRDFAEWARFVEWEIPPELARLAIGDGAREIHATNPEPNESLTLPVQVRLLARVIPEDRARARIEKAFRFREVVFQPEFAVSYEDARIDWQTGVVVLRKLPCRPFTPTLSAAEFDRHFMSGRDAAAKSAIDAEEPEKPITERTVPSSGIRTTTDEKVEAACGDWIGKLAERPHDKEAAFEGAKSAVAYIGVLSRKAFDRQWAIKAPAEWKQAGRRKRSPGRLTTT